MAKYDTVSKYLIQTYPGDIARFTLGRDDVEVLELLDTEQPSPQTLRTDSLIRVRLDGREVLLHTEFQTNDSRPPMPRRMAAYNRLALGPVDSQRLGLRVRDHF